MSCFLHSLAPKVWLQPVEFLSSTASHLVWCHGQKAKKPFVKLALKEHKRTRSKEGTGVNASWLRFVEEDFWCKGCSVYAPTRALSNPSSSGTGLLQRFHQSDITTLSFSFLHCQHCTRFFNALCEPNAIFIALVTVFKVASKWEDIHTYIYIYMYKYGISKPPVHLFIAACFGVVFSRAPSSAPLTRTIVHRSEVQWICIAGSSRGSSTDVCWENQSWVGLFRELNVYNGP